jgi:hypothetical protein
MGSELADEFGRRIRMAKEQLIIPRPDSACGKAFYSNRRTADGHRVALELWNRATGEGRPGYHLVVHRCKRCGGFHISKRRILSPASILPVSQQTLQTAE